MKNKILIFSVLFLLILSGCSNTDKVDPDEYIKESYPNGEQLAMTETDDQQVRLIRYNDQYEMVVFFKDGESYQFQTSQVTKKPYAQHYLKNNDDVYITLFIDNTLINADSFTLEVKSTDTDSVILHSNNLLKLDSYIVKAYHLDKEYSTMEPITLYDENGEVIPAELIIKDDESNYISNDQN